MSDADFNERKARTVDRHLKGADRAKRRKDNEVKKKRRTGRMDETDDVGEPENGLDEPAAEPRIAEVARTEVKVLHPDGTLESAQLARRLIDSGGVVVGDEVWFDKRGLVAGRAERRTLLQRRSPGQRHKTKILAANVDLGLVVLSPRSKGLALGFLDRAAAAFRDGGIEPIAVVTKLDLVESPSARQTLLADLDPWTRAGHRAFAVGSLTGEGVPELKQALRSSVSVFFGLSGVGKSTLVNALDPDAGQSTGEVREEDGRGRHTTTSSRLIPFMDGGALVDTPGIRVLVPDVHDLASQIETIPELQPLVGACRYNDCAHAGEVGCAITAAAETNPEVAAGLVRWRRLLESLEK